MNKLQKILKSAGVIFVILFCVKVIKDYAVYAKSLSSAPFYVWVLGDAAMLLLPAAVMWLTACILSKKNK